MSGKIKLHIISCLLFSTITLIGTALKERSPVAYPTLYVMKLVVSTLFPLTWTLHGNTRHLRWTLVPDFMPRGSCVAHDDSVCVSPLVCDILLHQEYVAHDDSVCVFPISLWYSHQWGLCPSFSKLSIEIQWHLLNLRTVFFWSVLTFFHYTLIK